ncbi:MAG TPA: hypothetical protein VG457_20140 [Planctomycetota bacterium]|jgi:hypothetical protein|nr:hypothetical protein [Planctomycetota bacterium]
MGQEISYCVRCANRIGGADFEKGKAYRVSGKGICAPCATPEEKKEADQTSTARARSTTRIKVSRPAGHGTSTQLAVPRSEAPPPSRAPLVTGLSLGALVLVGGAFWFLSDSPPLQNQQTRVRPPEPEAPAPAPPREKPEDALLQPAREAMEAARAKSNSAPKDLEAQQSAWEEAARKAALTPYFREASAELQAIRERLAASRPAEAPKPLEKPPAPPPEPAPKPVAEPAVTPAVWNAAMTKASAGDFESAAAELRREEAGKPEADDLIRAGAALRDSRGEISRLPAGSAIALDYRGDLGDRKRVEGVLVRAWAARLEIRRGEETVFVEITDILASSVAELCKASESLRRRYALLCLLEGDREGAERLAGGPDAFPARYWAYAKDAASKVPRVAPRELEARRLFYSAECDFTKPDGTADAISKYKTLLESYSDASIVKDEQIRIKARAEAGKDYLLSAYQLKGTGSFGLVASPRSEAAWTSKADVDGAQAVSNFVEAEFTALPGVSYRCWALVGACCAETFTFYLQATDGTDVNPKTKQKESIEPGAGIASLVRHTIKELAKSHRSHVTKIAKAPTKWEWISIPLPKYAKPGLKKIHLISDQQGFSVGAVVISSTRSAPPPDADLKDEAARAKAALADQGLSVENPGEKAWKPLFDGKSKESVLNGDAPGWKIEDGKLLGVTGINDAAQTRENFTDGQVRVRFEGQDLERLWFKLRQGGAAGVGYAINMDGDLKFLDGKPHELIFTARGDKVTATLDGKQTPVLVEGPATSGCLQFNGTGKRLAILSIDFRP